MANDSSKKISELPELNLSAMSDVTLVGNGKTAVGTSVATGTIGSDELINNHLLNISTYESGTHISPYARIFCVDSFLGEGNYAPGYYEADHVISNYLTELIVPDEFYPALDEHIFQKVLGPTLEASNFEGGCFEDIPYIDVSTEYGWGTSELPIYKNYRLLARREDEYENDYIGTVIGAEMVADYLSYGGSAYNEYVKLSYKPLDWDYYYYDYYTLVNSRYIKNTNPDWDAVSNNIYTQTIRTDLDYSSGDCSHYNALDNRIVNTMLGEECVFGRNDGDFYGYSGYLPFYCGHLSVSAIPSQVTSESPIPTLLCTGISKVYGITDWYNQPFIRQLTLDDLVDYVRAHL